MKVGDIMSRNVRTCSAHATLHDAARIMWESDCGCVPVVGDDGRLAGMITDRDICMAGYIQGVGLSASLVTTAMSRQIFSCRPQDDLAVAEKTMREKQVHRLPVVDERAQLVGILSLNDIVREAERERLTLGTGHVTDAEIERLLAAVSEPRGPAAVGRAA